MNRLKSFDLSFIFALAMLFSGAALLVTIYLHMSLGVALLLLGVAAASCIGIIWVNSSARRRAFLKRRFWIGFVAGLLATVGYDLVRIILVETGQLHFYPFETFNIFGKLIVGEDAPRVVTQIVGTTYHMLNGICFGIAYCLVRGGRHWAWGIGWAFVLEGFMLTVYPGWLDLEAVMKEFVAVSLIGHVVYGTILGLISQRFLPVHDDIIA